MIRPFALVLALLAAGPATADPIRLTETARIAGKRFPIPMEVTLRELDPTRVGIRVAGDLGSIQRNLPALLSRHVEESCERRVSVAVTDARAEGKGIRLTGQLQAEVYVCSTQNGRQMRENMLRQTAAVELLLGGEIVDGCLVMEVIDTVVRPDGFTGALMTASGYTARLNRDLARRIDRTLAREDSCIDLPAEFRALDTVVTGGGFRDRGGGALGAVIEGEMVVDARNFIRLAELVGRKRDPGQ